MINKQKKKEDVFEFPKVLTVADLSTRWKMSRQAIHKKIQEDLLFPLPVQIVSNGKIKLFLFVDISFQLDNFHLFYSVYLSCSLYFIYYLLFIIYYLLFII